MLMSRSGRFQGIKSVARSVWPAGMRINEPCPSAANDFSLSEGEWADIVAHGEKSDDSTSSQWKSGQFTREGILWPSPLLENVRSEPIFGEYQTERLTTLWSLSNSHGVSWDELDAKFIDFHKDYIARESEWVAKYDSVWDTEYKRSEDELRRILAKTIKDEAQLALTMNRRRGKIRRMTYSRISRIRFSEVLRPFHLKQFTALMRSFVSQKVAKREAHERATVK